MPGSAASCTLADVPSSRLPFLPTAALIARHLAGVIALAALWLMTAASAAPATAPPATAPAPPPKPGYAALASPTAALSQYKLDLWQTEQGLPLNTVQALLQTRDGALWVGTAGGLARFDGVRFTTFDAAQAPGMASEPVFGLMEDRSGALWVGHSRGAARYRQGRFETVIPAEVAGHRRVWALLEAPDGSVWAATEHGLLQRSPDGASFKRYDEADGLPSKRLRSLALDRQGWLWIATTGGGLAVRDPADGRFHALKPDNGLFPHLQVRQVLADPRGRGIWAATAGAGLVHIRAERTDGAPRFASRSYTVADGLPTDHLTALAFDAQGRLWIATWGAGLLRLEALPADDIEAPRFSPALSAEQGLAGSQIWSLLADREGSVWVGTWVGGLNRLRNRAFTPFGTPEGLAHDNVRSVLHTRDGASSWVASAGGGLTRIDHRAGTVEAIGSKDKSGGPLPTDEVSTLMEDRRDGSLWVGSYTAGIARLSPDGRRLLASYGLAQGLPNAEIRALLQDSQGRIWAGTRGGLARLDAAGEAFEAVHGTGLPQEGVAALLEDRRGRLWIGTTGQGLARLDADGRFTRLGKADGLLSEWIMALYEDSAGTLWIGTNGEGVNRLAADGRLAAIRTRDGLWDAMAQVILEDAQGDLWMSCNRGFFRVARAELDAFAEGRLPRVQSQGYGPGDALRATTFAGGLQSAGARDAAGRLWLPSSSGLVIVDPRQLPRQAPVPAVRLEGALVDGRPQDLAGGRVELPPGAVPLSLSYGAATLLQAERLRFRYRMDGLNKDWIDAGGARTATFPALPHGDYVFRVAASTDGLQWREAAAPLRITARPQPWQTPWFAALAALALLGGFAGLLRLRTRALQARQAEMERLVAQRTEELRQANEHLSRLSFADALTGLANRRRFDAALQEEWRRARRAQGPLALVIADIDSFKRYNDLLGHQEGDRCLGRVAGVFAGAVGRRAGDLAARYGGEEFVVLLPGVEREAALALAEQMRAACEALAIPHPDSPAAAVVTLSLGVAVCRPADEDATLEALVAAADAALYRAKQQGRNRVAG